MFIANGLQVNKDETKQSGGLFASKHAHKSSTKVTH